MKEKPLPETVCLQPMICTQKQTNSQVSTNLGWAKSAHLFARTMMLALIMLLSVVSLSESYGATITSTNTGGLWNATTTWVGAVVPQATDDVIIASGATVTINATGLVAKTLLVNGSLTYAATPASALTVGGSVTVSSTGSFTSPSSGTIITHALNIGGSTATGVGGDLVVDGIFNMNAFSTAGVVVTFYGTSNNTISGSGSTINFFALYVNKGSGNYNSVLEVVPSTLITMPDATATVPQRLTSTTGSFKLSSPSVLKPYYQSATPNSPPYGRLWLNNAAAVIQSVGAGTSAPSGGTLNLGGMLQIDAGTFSYGAGNSTISCYGGFSLNGPNATLNVYGVLMSGSASTFTMTAGNINIYPQVGANSAPTTYFSQGGLFQFGGSSLNFTGGTMTIFDPTLVVTSGMYYAPYSIYITAGTNNLSGSTIRLGDGISDLDGSPVGFTINSTTPLGNVVINNNPASIKTTRFVKLLQNTTIAGNLTINSGTANQLNLNNFTLTMGGNISNAGNLVFDGTTGAGLTFNGSAQQTVGGTGTFGSGLNNLTINNASAANPSVDLQIPLTVSNSLTLTKGSLGSSIGSALTLGKSAVSTTFSMTRSGGSLAVTPVFSLGGVTTNNVTYSTPSPAASITTGAELSSLPVTTFTVNNASGVTLDKPVSCTTLALTSGVLNVTGSNTITVTGSLATNITGGSATAYVNGPLTRTIPNNAVAANYKFPVGKTAYRLIEFASITTGGTGNAAFTAEAFDAGPYAATAGTGLSSINTDKYWSLSAALGAVTITSSSVRITDAGMSTTNRMGQSNAAMGTYNSIGGLGGATITSTNPIDYSAIAAGTYFRVGTVTAFASGTYAIGPQASYAGYAGTYATMTDAVTAITATPIPGPVVFEFQSDYNPAIEPAMVTLTSNIASSASSTITFRPAANVSSVINFSRASTVITNAGADYIIFDGRNGGTGTNKLLQFTNTTTTGAAITLSTDAQYNQIVYCILKGSTTTASTGLLTINAPSAGNNFLTVDNCNFDASGLANHCIYATGAATDATITNNNFFDYRNGAGIYLASGSHNAVIDNNSFYQTAVYNGLAGTTYGIFVNGGNNVRISNNMVGGNAPGLTGTWTVSATTPAAYNFTGIQATSLATTSKIYNNKIQNFDWKSNVSTWTGMNVSGTVNVGTDGANYVGNNTDNGNIKVTYFSTGAPQVNGIVVGGLANIENNIIGSVTTLLNAGITATGASFTGISSTGSGPIKNNTIGSKTIPLSINTAPQSTTGSAENVYGIYSTGGTVNFTNNTIANINNGSTVASGITRGILLPNYASTVSIVGNFIGSISTAQPVTGSGFTAASLDGINIQASNASSISISGNEISNLINNAATAAVSVNGIYYNAGTTGANKIIEKNYIHHFKTVSNTAILNGMNFNYSGAPVSVQNNIIQLGVDATGNAITSTAQINGIYRASAQACNIYYNTVLIEGTGVAAGAVNSYGLFISSHSTEDIRDNVFINTRSGGGTNYAIRVNATGVAPSGLTMNYNDYFVNGSGGVMGYYNGNIASLAAWKTATGLDANSQSIDPQFISANNLVPMNYSLAAGTPISGITTDFGGTTRNATTPTFGAYEAGAPAPVAYAVTGSGAYCQGDIGLPVGLASSEVGVIYTLFKDGAAQVPTVAGTGTAISFGNQLAGTYTVSGANMGGTSSMTGNAVITENLLPNAGVSGTLTICAGTVPTDAELFAQLSGSPDAGGSWSGPVAGIYTYTVKAIAPCTQDATATVTVTEQLIPNAGISGTLTVCAGTIPTNAELFAQLSGSPDAGGTWTGPVAGIYTYTVKAIAPCTQDATATVTVTEQLIPNAGISGTLTVCAGTIPTNAELFAQLSGSPDAGGTWTGPVAGVYTYTVKATAPCTNDATATVTVTEQLIPNAGISGTLTVCAGTVPTNAELFAQLGGSPDAGGTWTGPVAGVYTYTVKAIAPCTQDATATVTVTEQLAPNAGISGTLTVCAGTVPTDAELFAQLGGSPDAGGTWTGPVAGVYTYTVKAIAPCTNDATATVTVTEQLIPNAGISGTLTVCAGTIPTDAELFAQLGGSPDAGGTWSGPVAGIYTYTVKATAPCTQDATATVTVIEQATPNAGISGTLTICAGTIPTDAELFAQLSGSPDAGGTWSGPVAGIYTYTVKAIAPCTQDATATVTVTEQLIPNAGISGTLTICAGTLPTNAELFAQLSGSPDAGGTWSGPVAGIYTYTVKAIAPCTQDATATVTVTEQLAPNAGISGTLTICAGTLPTNAELFAQLSGSPDAGGTWSGPVAGIYTYTVKAIAPCTQDATATVTVTEQLAPNAGLSGTLTICAGTVPTNAELFAQLSGSPDAGGTWSLPVAGIYTYTVKAIAPCTNDATATVTIIEQTTPNAGTDAFLTICSGSTVTEAQLFAAIGTHDAGGIWSPALSGAGIYTYTVTATAPCTQDATATVTVTEQLIPNAGTDAFLTICSGSTVTEAQLFAAIGAHDAGGVWSPALSGAGIYTYTVKAIAPCTNDATATVTVTEQLAPNAGISGTLTICAGTLPTNAELFAQLSGSPDAGGTWTGPVAGIYTYTVKAIAPCTQDATATVTVTEQLAPNAGISGTLTICAGTIPTYAELFAQLGGSPDAGGTWSGPVAGVYSYTVKAIAPCTQDATATVTVTEQLAPNAGISGTLTICAGTVPTNAELFAQLSGSPDAGGTWSGPVAGIYTYTVKAIAPCTNDATASVTVIEQATPNAGTDAFLTICSGSTITEAQLFAAIGTHDAGGTWSGPVAGVYTYTVKATAPCTQDATATVTVTEQATPNAGISGTLTICAGTVPTNAELFAQLSGSPDAGGTWSLPVAGIYTYTVKAIAPCTNDATATVTIIEQTTPNAGTDAFLTICSGSTVTEAQLFAAIGTHDAGGVWSPALSGAGIYTYTVKAIAPCTNDATATVTVTEQLAPNAGISGTLTICAGTLPTNAELFAQLGGSPDAGGTWTGPVAGIYTYTVKAIAPCTQDATATVTVTEQLAPNAGISGTLTICAGTIPTNAELFAQLGGSPDAGGTWSGPVAGIYTYTVKAIAPCSQDATATVTVIEQLAPNAGTSGTLTVCAGSIPTNAELFAQLSGSPDAGGTWTGPVAGIYTYTVKAIAPCTQNATATVTVIEQTTPNAGTDAFLTICSGSTVTEAQLFAAIGTHDAGGVWSPALSGAGIYTYTVTATAPCNGSATAKVTVTEALPTTIAYNGSPYCKTGIATVTLNGQTGGTYSSTSGLVINTTTGTVDLVASAAGSYMVTYSFSNGTCSGSSTANITINAAPAVAPINGSSTVCVASTLQLSDATAGGIWSSGNTLRAIVSSTGLVTGISAGSVTIRYVVNNGCGIATATKTITVNALPTVRITNNTGTTLLSCTTTAISVTASGGLSYAWSGGLGNNATALISIPGTYTVTVTNSNGCSSTSSITIGQVSPIVSVTASAGTIAISGGTTTLTTTVVGSTGPYTYSLNGGTFQKSNNFTVSAGTYTVTVKDSYGCTKNSNTVTVVQPGPIATTLTYTGALSVQYYSTLNLSATLLESQSLKTVAGRTIQFTVGSQTVSATTNSKGQATVPMVFTQAAGNYQINATFAGDAAYSASSDNTRTLTVSKKPVTASLVGTVTKVYDGTAIAYLSPSNYRLSGTIPADVVSLNNPPTGTYNNNKVGTGKKVTVTGLALVGANAGNYVLNNTTISANIGTITTAIAAAFKAEISTDVQTIPLTELKVYPNPFTEKLNIEFSSPTDTHAKVEIFSIVGARLESLFDGDIKAKSTYSVEYIPRLVSSQVVIYRITMNGEIQQGKMIYKERN